jgi:hypothetical protein
MSDRYCKLATAAIALALLTGPALADAIDGDWCHNDGRRFSIRGPQLVTPGGKHMEGNYSRHWFSYVVPAPESGSGQTVFMTLVDENTVQTRLGEETAAKAETWIRCSPSTSALRLLPPA